MSGEHDIAGKVPGPRLADPTEGEKFGKKEKKQRGGGSKADVEGFKSQKKKVYFLAIEKNGEGGEGLVTKRRGRLC